MPIRYHRSVLGALGAAAVAVVLSGCVNAAGPPPPDATPLPSTVSTPAADPGAADHNDADVTFLQEMIPHHTQAITMSRLATTRASSTQVQDLAARINQAQSPEIARMTELLTAWGVPPRATSAGAGTPGMSMPGMITDQQMSQLAATSGQVFDRLFLHMMIGHHQGAITMARSELAHGQNPHARALAPAIITAQQAEITEMNTLLRQG